MKFINNNTNIEDGILEIIAHLPTTSLRGLADDYFFHSWPRKATTKGVVPLEP